MRSEPLDILLGRLVGNFMGKHPWWSVVIFLLIIGLVEGL